MSSCKYTKKNPFPAKKISLRAKFAFRAGKASPAAFPFKKKMSGPIWQAPE